MADQLSNQQTPDSLQRSLGLWDLVLFNVVAIVGLRWLSTAAQLGPSSLTLWVLAMVVFFIPSGLAVMELSSRLPGEGGVYIWTKAAFGDLHGFIAGWTYWLSNLVYFPSLLLFVAAAFLFLGGNSWLHLGESRLYNALFCLGALWLAVFWNMIGAQRGKWLQNIGGIGVWLVFLLLAVLGALAWWNFGSVNAITPSSLMPGLTQLPTLTFFATMTFGFAGLELAPIMGDEIREPRRAIPRALLISGAAIATIYIVGTAILLVAVPEGTIHVVSGLPQAVAAIGGMINFPAVGPLMGLMLTVVGMGALGAWMTGCARLPFVVGLDRYLPQSMARLHPRWGTPYVSLLVQGVLASLLLIMSVAGASIEEAYLVLLDMLVILYFIPFVYMFASLPKLRNQTAGKDSGVRRIPGGRIGLWLVTCVGLAATLFSIALAVIPPAGSPNPILFEVKVLGGSLLMTAVGLVFFDRGRRAG